MAKTFGENLLGNLNTDSNNDRPRVVLLTYPSLVGAQVINRVSAEAGINLVGIGLSNRVFKGASHLQAVATMHKRTGLRFTSYALGMTDLAWLLIRLQRAPRAFSDSSISLHTVRDINCNNTFKWLQDLQPDYVASCYFNQIIGRRVIDIGKLGCINLHAALLPALRGPEPCFRALERNQMETGLTVHLVDEEIDTGPILHQEQRQIVPGLSLSELEVRLWTDGAKVLGRWMAANTSRATALCIQALESPDYNTWPNPEEVKTFRRTGYSLSKPINDVRAIFDAAAGREPEYLPHRTQ